MADIIQLRRDTAANWASANPVLAQGEPGLDLDTNNLKWGDGSTAWNSLDYAIPSPTIAVPVRNTVMSGPTSWLAAGTGLQVISQNGAAIATIARGFGPNGQIDDVFEIPNATAWNSLASSSTVYLWAEHDGTTLTTGSGTLAPAYGPTAPASPSTGQWWFNTATYEGSEWDGSAWVTTPRLYVGQATTDGSGVTAVVQYAFNGKAVVGGTVTTNTNYNYNHNLGTTQCFVYGFFNNITGSSNTTFAPNGSGGFQIGIGYWSSGYRFSGLQLQNTLAIRLSTGSFRLYEQPRGAGGSVGFNFTGAESEIWVKRAF